MKIAKISNKPISVLLSVLVVLLSFAATGAFSISASASNNDNSQYAVTGEAVMSGYWENDSYINSRGCLLTYNSANDRYEVSLDKAKDTYFKGTGDFKFLYKNNQNWQVFQYSDAYTCTNNNETYHFDNMIKIDDIIGAVSKVTIWLKPVEKKFGFEDFGSGGGGETPSETIWLVAGSVKDHNDQPGIFDTAWDIHNKDNIMQLDSETKKYKKVYKNVPANVTYSFKVTEYISDTNTDDWSNKSYPKDNKEFTTQYECTVIIWFDSSLSDDDENKVTVDFIQNPTTYTVKLGSESYKMNATSNSNIYSYTFANGLSKGNNSFTVELSGGETGTHSGTYSAQQWDSGITVKYDISTKKISFETPTYPQYVIFDGQTSDGFINNNDPHSPTPKYVFSYNNNDNVYTLTDAFKVADGKKDYSYKISKNGSTVVDNGQVNVTYDNSTIKIKLNVTGLNSFSSEAYDETGPTYTCKYGTDKSTNLSLNNGRYEASFKWEEDTTDSTTLTFTGAQNGDKTVSISQIKKNATIKVWYDESANEFKADVQNPDEHTYGDLNGDGSYNVIDAYIIRKIADTNGEEGKLREIGLEAGTGSVEYKLADVNGNGSVTQDDVDLMNDYIVGNIPEAEKENIGKPYAAT